MKTAKERQEAFEKDLNELLVKHNAEIELEEVGGHNYARGEDTMVVHMQSIYDDNELIAEYTEFKLGRWVAP